MTKSLSVEVVSQEWYQKLLEDCQTIIVERVFRARSEIIDGKWEVGERIQTDNNYQKNKYRKLLRII